MKIRFQSPRRQKHQISDELKAAINYLYYDQGLHPDAIRERLKVGHPKIDKALYGSKSEWEKHKQFYQLTPAKEIM